MSKLVFINNNQVVTDSLTVADVFGKNHADVLRDIRVQLEKLNEAGESDWGISNFAETQYQHEQNKQWYKKYNLTEEAFTLVAFAYITPEAMKMKITFIQEFKRMREELAKQFEKPKSQAEMLLVYAQQFVEQEKRLTQVEDRLAETEKKQENLSEIVALNSTNWKEDVTKIINKIAQKTGGYDQYRNIRNESYEILERRANAKLSTRVTNKKQKMALEGAQKSQINRVSKVDVIGDDKRLLEIYLAVVKEMAIKYQVDIEASA
jgi:Rha family phage regulatory protein